MRRSMLIVVGAVIVLLAGLNAAATAVVLYSEDWESYADNTDITGGGVPGWEGVGKYWDDTAWRTMTGVTIRVWGGLYPDWGQALSADFAGGYYNNLFRVVATQTWYKNTVGTQVAGSFTGSFKVSPYCSGFPDYPAAYSWIGLATGYYTQVATWQFVAQPSYPTNVNSLKLVYAGGESAEYTIDGNDQNTILTINLNLTALTVSGTITQGGNVQNTPVFSIPAGTTFDSVAFFENKWAGNGKRGFDVDDMSLTRTGGPGSIAGSITLGNYSGDLELAPIKIELLQGGTVVRTEWVTPTANPQSYTLATLVPGTYDVRFTAGKFLRKVVAGVQVLPDSQAPCSPTLTNGDTDGDNEVTSTDLSAVLSYLGEIGN